MKKKVLFFAREYQADFFPLLLSEKYNAYYVTLTLEEKRRVEAKGQPVFACFEEMSDTLSPDQIPESYFLTSFASDRFMGDLSLAERQTILGKEIAFWRFALEEGKADAVINETVAIETSEVLLIEAQKRGIPYHSWMSLPVPNTFYFQRTPMYSELDQRIQEIQPGSEDLAKAEMYMEKVRQGAGAPFYAQNLKKRGNPVVLLKNVKRWFLAKKRSGKYARNKSLAVFGAPQRVFGTQMKLYFLSLFRKYRKQEGFKQYELIFYPMHFEPEATLRYMSEFYSNQVATIESISKCLKTNQVLVIKEHPQQPGMFLTYPFRQIQRNYSNILLLPAEIPTSELIKDSAAIVTLTSTAGFEGLILGKPVFVLGKVFYNQCPGVYKILSYEELREKLRAPSYLKPSAEKVKHFIAQMIHYANVGNPYPHANLYASDNIAAVTRAIERQLGI